MFPFGVGAGPSASTLSPAPLAFAASRRPELEGLLGDVSLAGLHAKELTVLAVCLAGVVVYGVLLFALGGLTRAEIRAALRRRGGASVGEPDLS